MVSVVSSFAVASFHCKVSGFVRIGVLQGLSGGCLHPCWRHRDSMPSVAVHSGLIQPRDALGAQVGGNDSVIGP
jgi:hypothetical protein